MAPSTALPTTARSSPFASGSFRSSATAAASGPGSISTTRPPPPFLLWSRTARRSTTSSTTIRLPCESGCRGSPRRSARSRRGASPPGLRGCWQARLWLSCPPRRGVPRTRRPSASSAGRHATQAGAGDSPPCTRRSAPPTGRGGTRPHRPVTRQARTRGSDKVTAGLSPFTVYVRCRWEKLATKEDDMKYLLQNYPGSSMESFEQLSADEQQAIVDEYLALRQFAEYHTG